MEERRAITRLKHGDLAGLETLVQKYQLQALRTAYLIVGDPALAEDIVQEAFLTAIRRIDQFDLDRPFSPWFMRSVVHASIKAAARQQRQVSLDTAGPGETQDWVEWLIDPQPSPEDVVETEETRQAIWRALEQLSPKHRAAVVMRYYLEMSDEEMGQVLASPAGTIRWWLHASRLRLRQLLAPLRSNKTRS